MPGFDMKDYVPVNERVEQFYAAFPNGSIQSEIVELTDKRVTVKAFAYRTPDDPRPGIGHSYMTIPGPTSYTKGSEIENAETSAWGRAIAALGFEVKRGIASREEVANKQPSQGTTSRPLSAPVASTPPLAPVPAAVSYRREELALLAQEKGLGADALTVYADLVGIEKGKRATDEQMDRLIEAVRGHGSDAVLDLPAPPQPGSDEYLALQVQEKAAARAYWAGQAVTA